MKRVHRYSPADSRFFTFLLRHTYGPWLLSAYGVTGRDGGLMSTLKPPFVVVGNHSMTVDPFVINTFVPHPMHWISADSNMRTPLMRFLLIKVVGCIPKSKAIPDIETVNWIVRIIRKRQGVVGIFPEGSATWSGSTLPTGAPTAKLLKLLKVPVVVARTRGAYLSKPRWSYVRRKGRVDVELGLLFTPEELKRLDVEEIRGRLDAAIASDDHEWRRKEGVLYRHPRRAETLELALYTCPSCGGIATLRSRGAAFRCDACGMEVEYGEDASLRFKGGGRESGSWRAPACDPGIPPGGFFPDVGAWDRWQDGAFAQEVRDRAAADPEAAILSDEGVTLLRGFRMQKMHRLGRGRLVLRGHEMRFEPEGAAPRGGGSRTGKHTAGAPVVFDARTVDGIGVLKWNCFEFYDGMDAYRVLFADRRTSGRKWASALEALQGSPEPAAG